MAYLKIFLLKSIVNVALKSDKINNLSWIYAHSFSFLRNLRIIIKWSFNTFEVHLLHFKIDLTVVFIRKNLYHKGEEDVPIVDSGENVHFI